MLFMLLAGVCACATAPDTSRTAIFQRILDDSARANGVIGAQAAVLIPGEPLWTGVTGEDRPGVPMTSDRLIGTGSISKLYTAVAAMLLIDRGRFGLEDTVGRWFPNLANVSPSITVLQLLRHTSGLADYSAAPGFGQVAFADRNRVWSIEELLAFVGQPLFAPGTSWNASNTNRLLLASIAEQESGLSLGAFMRRELFGTSSTLWLSGDGPAPPGLATQWFVDGSGNRVNVTETLFGPALFSVRREVQATAADLAAFGDRLLGGDLLSPAMKEAMLTIVPDDGKIPEQTGGGLGIRQYRYSGRTLYGHSGATNNATALFLYDPATGIVAAMSVNQDGPSHRQSHFRTVPALLFAAIEAASRGAGAGR